MSDNLMKLVFAILLVADKKRVTHLRIRPGRAAVGFAVEHWIDGRWQPDEIDPKTTVNLFMPLVRTLATMLSTPPPWPGEVVVGGFQLNRSEGKPPLFAFGALDHTDPELVACIELVDEAAYVSGRGPRPPRA